MANISDLLDKKGSEVATVQPQHKVWDAVLLMNEQKIGSLVVVDESHHILGMFTERDVLQRIVGEERDARATSVGEVMTTEVACCIIQTSVGEARAAMRNRRIRHLPVLDEGGALLGLISIGDLNAFEAAEQEHQIYLLHEYMHGRV